MEEESGIQGRIEKRVVRFEDLKMDPKNPNLMSKEQEAGLKESIARFGYVVPIVVDADTMMVADGEHRLMALRTSGVLEAEVVLVHFKDDLERRMFRQVANKLKGSHEAGKDTAELLELLEADRINDLGKMLGETPGDLLKLLDKRDSYDPDEWDEEAALNAMKDPFLQTGDVVYLGPHVLVVGDSTDPGVWEQAFVAHGSRPNMMLTDPPYNVNYGVERPDGHPTKERSIMNDNMESNEFYAFLRKVFDNSMRHVSGAQYVFMSSQEWPNLQRAFLDAGGHWSSTIVWVKQHFVLSRKDYQPQFEPLWKGKKAQKDKAGHVLYGWAEGNTRGWQSGRTETDVWYDERPAKSPAHPTSKPLNLLRKALLNSSKPQMTVMDPFLGGGSTMIACEQTKRKCVGIEMDPKYASIAVDRYLHYTGTKNCKIVRNGTETTHEAPAKTSPNLMPKP